MAFIWINPVTDSMYETDVLNEFLKRHGYKRLNTSVDWITVVKEKYRTAVEQAEHPVMDVRCPKIKEILDETGGESKITIPSISPILIHCGCECGEREDLRDEEKIITTPCQALADMGNALKLQNTRFVPWNCFVKSLGDKLESIPPKKSPIPPGFFEELGLKTVSVTGEDEIREYFKEDFKKDFMNNVQLVEMLFCKEGCHNGDGMRMCDS